MARDAKKEYKTQVNSLEEATEIFFTDDQMKVNHEKFYQKALDFFGEHQMGDDESNSELLNLLTKVCFKVFIFIIYDLVDSIFTH